MVKTALLALGMLTLVGAPAIAQKSHGRDARAAWKAADPALKHRVRLNRGVFNLVGQQANIRAICGVNGGRSVRTRSNGWDALLSVASVGLYTPQHADIVCNCAPGPASAHL